MKTVCLFLLSLGVIFADIEDHLKPVRDKSGHHGMRNIDFIYMINLDQRPEKFESCLQKLTPYQIFPCRFSAVNGWELTWDAIDDIGVKYEPWMSSEKLGTTYLFGADLKQHAEKLQVPGRTYYCHDMGRGSIGIVLSHLSILKDAYESGYETIWVMEDDIEVIGNPHMLPELIDKLDALVGKDGWDILFTDTDTKARNGNYVVCLSYAWRPNFTPSNPKRFSERVDVSPDFKRIGARYGAYSMIVRRSGMRKLLRFFDHYHLFLPFDMDYTLPEDIRLYGLRYDLVSTEPNAITDNELPNYLMK
jgi:GR25 family glycosyltransferase involved in LPS biosynthesis